MAAISVNALCVIMVQSSFFSAELFHEQTQCAHSATDLSGIGCFGCI